MKILRLSLFNLKKNKREAIGIMVLTFFTAFMLIIALSNKIKVDTAFDESFEMSGSTEYAVMFRGEKYRDEFRHILSEDYGITDVAQGRMLWTAMVDAYASDGGT
ncbi:MAG: hypothetical protein J6Z09_01420, partial [Lachnospiraceae bacterium]|nr:hypothetical protein [Lachnospiraceae bacterium]